MDKSSIDTNRYDNYAWEFFSLHAQQRISLIRLYVSFFTIYIYAISYFILVHIKKTCKIKSIEFWVILVLSGSFILVTILFWLMDNRCKNLIGYAKDFFVMYENNIVNLPSEELKIFNMDKNKCEKKCLKLGHNLCFKLLFIFGLILSLACFALDIFFYNSSICLA